jgi:hypothetical protein
MGGNATEQVRNQGGGTNPSGGVEHSRMSDRNRNQTCSNALWQMAAALMQAATNKKNKQQIGKE